MRLLDRSPMPWNYSMLRDWFGGNIGDAIIYAAQTKRIWRIERGMYTSAKHYGSIIVTDEMIARYIHAEIKRDTIRQQVREDFI